jgi:hemerythrin-like domain-containing protein
MQMLLPGVWGSKALDDLRTEYFFMTRLLEMLETQVRLVAEEKLPDGQLLLEISQYLTGFPDLFHHPKKKTWSSTTWQHGTRHRR